MADCFLTVTELNEYLRMLFESQPQLNDIFVRGEISNFVPHRSGHFYFSLKDENCLVRAVMFRSYAERLKFLPQTGMKVILHGRVGVFPRDGQYQIYADDIQPDGVGGLYLAFEQLKKKLEAEGLFDPARKRPLPRFPMTVGVVTSPTGAAVRDILQILGRRFPLADVLLYPSLVQGPGAAENLTRAVEWFSENRAADVLIVGRGGGSAEDLWAFNDETLARAVAASAVPVISAVGHETDFTICDFAADLRAPTPSAAAELAVPETAVLRTALAEEEAALRNFMLEKIRAGRAAVEAWKNHRALQSPRYALENRRLALDALSERLSRAAEASGERRRAALAALAGKMETLNPLSVLSRGFSAVKKEDGKYVSGASALAAGDRITLRFADGLAEAGVTSVRIGDKNG